jgi:hypothetical protein
MSLHPAPRPRLSLLAAGLRGATAAGLALDAVIHLQLASRYQLAAPGGIGQGNLFRVEAAAAILAALYVLLRGSRPAYAAAFVVAASALGAVLLYRYVNVGALGPIPSMYEPIWFAKKTAAALAEAVSTLAAVAGLARGWQAETRH